MRLVEQGPLSQNFENHISGKFFNYLGYSNVMRFHIGEKWPQQDKSFPNRSHVQN